MIKRIPHVRLTLGSMEIKAISRVVESGHLAMGDLAETLGQSMARVSNQKYGAVVSSGTAALHISLLVLGIKAGDEVILPAYSCQALLNAVHQVGAIARLADIDLSTYNIDPEAVKQQINDRTKALIVPHMFGLMAEMPALIKLGVPIIEDCAMGLGASWQGRPAGSFGTLAVFSFYATKMITCGEGGAVTTSDVQLMTNIRDLREYDRKREYRLRYNYKLSDLNAALALSQLNRLKIFVNRREFLARRYSGALQGITGFVLPSIPGGHRHAFARYIIRTTNGDNLRAYLKENGVEAGRGVAFGLRDLIRSDNHYPNSTVALEQVVSLPIYPTLTTAEQDRVIHLLLRFKE